MSAIDYINLIYKQLSNEISVEESDALNKWMLADQENQQLVDQFSLIWDNADLDLEKLVSADVDVDAEFSFLMDRIEADQVEEVLEAKTETKLVKLPIYRTLSIAAGFALLLGLSWFFIAQFSNPSIDFAEIKTGDQAQEILLADGTQVFLNANSSLKYPTEFTGDSRLVEFSGEAFFDVAKDPQHPFMIKTPYEDVTVLGTSFNVRAYENEPNSEISVSTGKVQVNSGLTSIVLVPNQKVIVDHSSKVMGMEETVSLNELAWHTKTIRFSNTGLAEVLADMENFFQVKFILQNQSLANCPYTDSFKSGELETAISSISKVFDLTFTPNENGDYVLVGGVCP